MIENPEATWLELVSDMQVELADALSSLTGKQHEGLQDVFPIYSAAHINRTLDGYILLRRSSRIDASKLLNPPRFRRDNQNTCRQKAT